MFFVNQQNAYCTMAFTIDEIELKTIFFVYIGYNRMNAHKRENLHIFFMKTGTRK